MVDGNPFTSMQEEFLQRLKLIEDMLSNLVNTIMEMQRNHENEKKEKENLQIGESS